MTDWGGFKSATREEVLLWFYFFAVVCLMFYWFLKFFIFVSYRRGCNSISIVVLLFFIYCTTLGWCVVIGCFIVFVLLLLGGCSGFS